jgi:hypothetical protein
MYEESRFKTSSSRVKHCFNSIFRELNCFNVGRIKYIEMKNKHVLRDNALFIFDFSKNYIGCS